ncbi:hypothetical protein CVV68_04545 [Arthrobacter livingstonensis]|uniref:Uncharacterized protein n=1 Tax=Arthrobacter livingstonensis TaxID=670078 RepID=A0A2V5LBQ1_9MICC|nr:hypothetical protein [Arthrobacter livingstonensis]PYI69065.1 hypothetical protein CVV68_04545 [Arthrobacter livingstonensis]
MAGGTHSGKSEDTSRNTGSRLPDARRAEHARGPTPAPATLSASGAEPSLWLSTPWLAILFITGVFHVYRGVPVDAFVFLSVGVALAVDTAVRHSRHSRPRGRRGRRPDGHAAIAGHVRYLSVRHPTVPHAGVQPGQPVFGELRGEHRGARVVPRWLWIGIAVGTGAISLAVVVLAPEGSSGIPAVVCLVGAAMLLVAWPDPPRPPGPPAPRVRRAAYWWAGVVLFLCIWELGTYFIDRFAPDETAVFPPLTDLLQPLFDGDSSRWFMTGLWLVACGALLRVVRSP